jgi:hypothetical protein
VWRLARGEIVSSPLRLREAWRLSAKNSPRKDAKDRKERSPV